MSSEELPLPDWDQQPPGALEHRIRSLDSAQLRTLLRHERAHADRPVVKHMLDARLAQLSQGAEPTPGGEPPHSDSAAATRTGSPVSPATATEPRHAPPHGSPHQPGQGDRMGP